MLFKSLLFVAGATLASAAAPVNQLAGYATQNGGTTGGGSATAVTVTSCSALASAVAGTTAAVVKVSGLLSGCGIIDVGSSKTIWGVGSNSGLTNGGGLRVKGGKNVIIRNMVFHTPPAGKDLVELQTSTNIWLDHNEFSSEGIVGDKDTYDGLLDITHGDDWITVSWNVFTAHWKGSLIGHSDSNASEDTGKLHVTYHHNIFSNINSRTPSIRFGTAHIYSSYFTDIPTSGINSRMGAQVLVEANAFNNVQLAVVTDLDSDEDGYAVERNNVYTSSTTRITQAGSLSVPYTYTIDAAASVKAILDTSAGTGIVAA